MTLCYFTGNSLKKFQPSKRTAVYDQIKDLDKQGASLQVAILYNKPMKKVTYITLFTLLGILLSFLVHALVEIPVIALLVSDFERWGLGLSWETWEMIHMVGGVVLLIGGIVIGFLQGRHWWGVLYETK